MKATSADRASDGCQPVTLMHSPIVYGLHDIRNRHFARSSHAMNKKRYWISSLA